MSPPPSMLSLTLKKIWPILFLDFHKVGKFNMYTLDVGWESKTGFPTIWNNYLNFIEANDLDADDNLKEFGAVDRKGTRYVEFETSEGRTYFILKFS
jgi:hypothetical protein